MPRLPHQLLIALRDVPAAGQRFEGRLAGELLELETGAAERIAAVEPVRYALQVSRVGDDAVVRGSLHTRLHCRCDRCLRDFELEISVPQVFYFYEDAGEQVIDLTPDLREDTLLALPQRLLCRPDCPGLCPECGLPRDGDACRCEPDVTDDSPWSALDELSLPDAPPDDDEA